MNSNLDVLAVGTAICIIDEENKPIKDIYFPSRSEQLVERMQKIINLHIHPSCFVKTKHTNWRLSRDSPLC